MARITNRSVRRIDPSPSVWDPHDPRDDSSGSESGEFVSDDASEQPESESAADETAPALSEVDPTAVELLPGRPAQDWLRLVARSRRSLPSAVVADQGQAAYEQRRDATPPDATDVDLTS